MKDSKDTDTLDIFGDRRPRGRPRKHATDDDYKAARAAAARERRAREKAEGWRTVKIKKDTTHTE